MYLGMISSFLMHKLLLSVWFELERNGLKSTELSVVTEDTRRTVKKFLPSLVIVVLALIAASASKLSGEVGKGSKSC